MSQNSYFWSVNVHPDISAQTAGEELERIGQLYGKISPGDVVTESRPANAPLHGCFTWNDSEAASRWREDQARKLIGAIRVKVEIPERKKPAEVRAFVRTASKTYEPIVVAVQKPETLNWLLADAWKDVERFQAKYATLKEAVYILNAMETFMEETHPETV